MIPLTLISILAFVYSFKSSIVVTDKRVYGVSTFGRRVDIPIQAISSAENGMIGCINIVAFSKKISFVALENNNEVCKVIWDLISEKDKQSNNKIVDVIQEDKNGLDIDDLRKYKSLLDDGIISQEEFEVKKQQILRL
ncbi:MAG: SHOCT domain-containing protein [Lachnospiraceae bacterium]|nr:SHOCT domain-containing protein [Lachnospiraceae bacterium]